MQKLLLIVILFSLTTCDSVEIIDSWKNPDIETFESTKILIVGITSNIEARRKFERKLKEEYELRGVEAAMSLDLFEPTFTTEKKSAQELKIIEGILVANGFNSILFTKIIGVEDLVKYKENFDNYENTYRKFKDEYLKYQDIYYNPEYYDEYTVYHTETSLYCICTTKDIDLIWKGNLDISDPFSMESTVSEYVNLLILTLENQQVINPILKINPLLKKEKVEFKS